MERKLYPSDQSVLKTLEHFPVSGGCEELLAMVSGEVVAFGELEVVGDERERSVVVEEGPAGGEKIRGGGNPANLVEKTAGGLDAEGQEVHVFFHFLDLRSLTYVRGADAFVEAVDVAQDGTSGWAGDGESALVLADLLKEPGVANSAASEHESVCSGDGEDVGGVSGGMDVAIGNDGAGECGCSERDGIVVDFAGVALGDGASVDGEEVDAVFFEDGEQLVEDARIVKADAGLDGEGPRDGRAKGSEDAVDSLRIAEQAATGALAIDDGCRAAEVEIDGGDGVVLQFAGGTDEGGDVVADHLCDDGTSGGILRNGLENPFIEAGVGGDAEIFGDIDIRAAVFRHQTPEGKIGDILHGSQKEQGFGA